MMTVQSWLRCFQCCVRASSAGSWSLGHREKTGIEGCASAIRLALSHLAWHGFPSVQAKAVGNITAMACMAKLLDAGGRSEEGLSLWRKCAKAGLLEGQLRLGLAVYRGTCGAVQDAEEAHMYLNRAVKQVTGSLAPCGY
jgi:TPR repeat protein